MRDYIPTRFTFCRRRGRKAGVGFHQDDRDRVDPSPRDRQSGTCVKPCISETIDGPHVAHLGGVDLHQTDESHLDFGTSPAYTWTPPERHRMHDAHKTVAIDHKFGNHRTPRGRFRNVRSPLDGRRKRSKRRRCKRWIFVTISIAIGSRL